MDAKRQKMEPRRYQVEALERALKENTILYLDTGSGKTFIAVLLLNSAKERLKCSNQKRIGVFLAPTVALVIQQARVISTMCEVLKVGVYYGAKGVDTWSLSEWQKELNSHQVFVMTPQVFLDALNTSALSMNTVELLIFDECHHAQGKHPYALIMKIHYHGLPAECKPKIFGMTASPIIGKGISMCSKKIRDLENVLDSKVYTLAEQERKELEVHAPTPKHIVKSYKPSTYDFSEIQSKLEAVSSKFASYGSIPCSGFGFSDEFQYKEKVQKSIQALHVTIDFCLSDMGLLGASMAVDMLLNVDRKMRSYYQCEMDDQQKTLRELEDNYKTSYLQDASLVFMQFLKGFRSPFETEDSFRRAQQEGLVTSKVELLLHILMSYRTVEDLRCIVFVERVLVTMVLAKMISGIPFLDFIHCDYVAGANADLCHKTPNAQQQTLDDFAAGKLNVLIATAVAEEGIDIQSCSSVIRFDLCQTLRSHIQSRGRARRHGSEYTWLLESGNVAQEMQFLQISESEKTMKEEALSRSNMDLERRAPFDPDLEIFRVHSGACRSTEDSVSFIHQYCARLPGDRYYNPKPEFTFDGLYTCTVHFPPNAPLNTVEGPIRKTEQLAKKAACLKACELLYDIGAVRSDTLCPEVEEIPEETALPRQNPQGGKPKELFSSVRPAAFRGSFLEQCDRKRLQLYVVSFSVDAPGPPEAFASFALLTEELLHDEVINFEVELHLTRNRTIKTKLSSCGQIELNKEQLKAAKEFHELLFNAAFGRFDVENATKAATWRDVYLLLPMDGGDKTIDWKGIFSTAKARCLFVDGFPMQMDVSDGTLQQRMVHTAAGLRPISSLENSVVLTVHIGEIFCITGVLDHLNATSTFPGNNALTYLDYFKDKHNKQLRFLEQPLLEAKHTHSFHNLLNPRPQPIDTGLVKERRDELPPELCLPLELRSSVVSSLYLLPSYMFRLRSFMCANELSLELARFSPAIPTLQVLEALTSKKCQSGSSYERLELLGDSFLKYAITRRLFLYYSSKHEGQLSVRRSHATCNAALSKLAKKHGFTEYICNDAFEPSYWTGPGMFTPGALICQHETESMEPIGRTCIEGHRWIRSKVTADVVEALIGAYLVSAGPGAALEFMKGVGLEVEVEQSLIDAARNKQISGEVEALIVGLERKIGYTFHNKSLLLEAITHASHPFSKLCYQRLEFLGDSAIDFLLSQHFYYTYPEPSPGVLTDLRSAAVNNGCFARVAVKHGLHGHLRHGCDELHRDVRLFAKSVENDPAGSQFGFDGAAAPKILGDLVESIAGAILVDTGFSLEELWRVILFLFSPLVTPDDVLQHPVRELGELCSSKNFVIRWMPSESSMGLMAVELRVRAGDVELVETGKEKNKKAAKKQAAQKMLAAIRLKYA